MTILILTVGGSHQPLLTAIQSVKPDRVVFLCSDDLGRRKGSYRQVTGRGKVLKSHPGLKRRDLANLVTLAGMAEGSYEVVKIGNFDDLEECFVQADGVIERMRAAYPGARLLADYSGGTKCMTAGLALAALEDERCEVNLVAGARVQFSGRMLDRIQFARPAQVGEIRARKLLHQVGLSLGRYDYSGAAALLEAINRRPLGETLHRALPVAISACHAFDAWDRLAYGEARQLLTPYRQHFVDHYLVLEALCLDSPLDRYLKVEEILLGAERRAAQGRYDDSLARLYRALEMIAQIRLGTYGIDTASVDLSRVPEGERAGLGSQRAVDGKVVLNLFSAWTLLEALGDAALSNWFRQRKDQVKDFLIVRNQSILAHGTTPIDVAVYRSQGERTIELCREALGRIPRSQRGPWRPLQFPTGIDALGLGTMGRLSD